MGGRRATRLQHNTIMVEYMTILCRTLSRRPEEGRQRDWGRARVFLEGACVGVCVCVYGDFHEWSGAQRGRLAVGSWQLAVGSWQSVSQLIGREHRRG
jgi:hypothetical protein